MAVWVFVLATAGDLSPLPIFSIVLVLVSAMVHLHNSQYKIVIFLAGSWCSQFELLSL